MNAAEIMTALAAYDATVAIEGDRVRVRFPPGSPPPADLIEVARGQKEALRTILAGNEDAGARLPYGSTLAALRAACPDLIEADRWQQAIEDADCFLQKWGAHAHALGWTVREVFRLHPVPSAPAPTFQRLSRYDATGLIWLLRGRPVIALTATEAAIQSAGAVVMYRKHRKPAFGPLGDSLDDMASRS
jgi:hypothetical protein